MIASKNSIEAKTSDMPLPNSRKVYIDGQIHPTVRVPFREISLAPTKSMDGRIEVNEPVRVYDTSGPWGDPVVLLDVKQGLSAMRTLWVRDRGDVEEYEGRVVRPIDDGYLSEKHAADAAQRSDNGDFVLTQPTSNGSNANGNHQSAIRSPQSAMGRKPLRASAGHAVTQLWYARQGIITPEMEFIAVRENLGRAQMSDPPMDGFAVAKIRGQRSDGSQTSNLNHQTSNVARNACGQRSRAAAPSFRPTSITRNRSR